MLGKNMLGNRVAWSNFILGYRDFNLFQANLAFQFLPVHLIGMTTSVLLIHQQSIIFQACTKHIAIDNHFVCIALNKFTFISCLTRIKLYSYAFLTKPYSVELVLVFYVINTRISLYRLTRRAYTRGQAYIHLLKIIR